MDLSVSNVRHKFLDAWQSSEKTGQQVVRGSFLIFFERFIIKILYFIRTVILARLLFPDDFGLFGMAVLAMNVTEVFFQHGFNSALIQKKENVGKYLDTAWTVILVRNVFLAGLLFFVGAPLAGQFFNNGAVVMFAKALALVFLISGLENIGVILFQKEMRFNRYVVYILSGATAEVVAVIIAAFILRNPWALVIGVLANKIAYLLTSYFVHPYRPRFSFDWGKAKELFYFGKWIGISGIVAFLVSQGDYLVVGKLLDASSLGFYQLAFALGTLPAVEMARSLGNVLFPLYAKIQNDRQLLNTSFIRISGLVFALIVPALFGLAILANEAVEFVYGERWLPMVSVLYVILALALPKALDFMINPLFMGIGKPKITTAVLVVQSLIMFGLIIPLTQKYGIIGTAGAVLAGSVVAEFILLLKLRKEINLRFRALVKMAALPLVGSLAMAAVLHFSKSVISPATLPIFIAYIAACALIYFAVLYFLDQIFDKRFYESLIWIKKNL